ncbi:MAG: hypothetical protein WA517_22810 [Candidatus Acidiferrum sp.]
MLLKRSRHVLFFLLGLLLAVPSIGQQRDMTIERAMRKITKSYYAHSTKRGRERPASFDINDWPADTTRFVKLSTNGIPILSQAGLTAPTLHVVAISKKGELMALLERAQIIELVNPLGGGVNGSGIWLKVRLLDGREGWLFANQGDGPPLFATVVEKINPSVASNGDGLAIGLVVLVVSLIVLAMAKSARSKKAVALSSSGDGGYRAGGGYSQSATEGGRAGSRSGLPMYQAATSRRVEGVFEDRTEHYDKGGHRIAQSREREGLLGKYVEHFDENDKKIGESRTRDGLLGKYTEHTDNAGRKVGESHRREGLLESFTEHTDKGGKKTGESRTREGWFGDFFTEHEQKKDDE